MLSGVLGRLRSSFLNLPTMPSGWRVAYKNGETEYCPIKNCRQFCSQICSEVVTNLVAIINNQSLTLFYASLRINYTRLHFQKLTFMAFFFPPQASLLHCWSYPPLMMLSRHFSLSPTLSTPSPPIWILSSMSAIKSRREASIISAIGVPLGKLKFASSLFLAEVPANLDDLRGASNSTIITSWNWKCNPLSRKLIINLTSGRPKTEAGHLAIVCSNRALFWTRDCLSSISRIPLRLRFLSMASSSSGRLKKLHFVRGNTVECTGHESCSPVHLSVLLGSISSSCWNSTTVSILLVTCNIGKK